MPLYLVACFPDGDAKLINAVDADYAATLIDCDDGEVLVVAEDQVAVYRKQTQPSLNELTAEELAERRKTP